jgi:hypothetical protein
LKPSQTDATKCKDTETTLQILNKPDKKFKNYLVKKGMLATINDVVEIIIEMKDSKKKVFLAPLELMLNYCHTIDSVETAITVKKYHGGLNKEFVENMDRMKLEAHERLIHAMKLSYGQAHTERSDYEAAYVQQAIERFWKDVVIEHKQAKKIIVRYTESGDWRERFNVEVVEYFKEYQEDV